MKRLHKILAALVVLMLAVGGSALAAYEHGKGQVNVNTATKDELVWFLGLSSISDAEMVADNILAYRDANGPLDDLAELRKVNGIDRALFDRIKFRVKVSGPTDHDPEIVTPSPGHIMGSGSLRDPL
ncbi:MAG TPA: helix-hairpin-helix domain-containing protein [Deltaproteobacteria bacterium]|jgi:competence ComEA-like helix-hairpin-helix protein|nr:helix-hairpin-helix domain-containing protein [Deltaproteobacteria bacterium]HOI05724.1 helix-hairpin-helix domain-containing protein [Deltaproteobacteria bacterium]